MDVGGWDDQRLGWKRQSKMPWVKVSGAQRFQEYTLHSGTCELKLDEGGSIF